ncbi:hypothetical protein HBI63_128190 [Parastagonospora nodorum]|nr:hypothetical protein HBH43_138860 [Parastagonospora nodorum]KAH4607809.1 hypothetical protein HBH82_087010 [Parastagonospora nodorum]KAH4709451.1 hypothetical protein HBH67_051000 [Parastagonospora nodorum]KAH4802454.1 hypothetical protein HBH63_068310 [Parastagonospora nodorum]KAH5269780.1 hypothetical protein HBI71_065980 [Parastagonospora nodorum]
MEKCRYLLRAFGEPQLDASMMEEMMTDWAGRYLLRAFGEPQLDASMMEEMMTGQADDGSGVFIPWPDADTANIVQI